VVINNATKPCVGIEVVPPVTCFFDYLALTFSIYVACCHAFLKFDVLNYSMEQSPS
jgi:hypothetical protein